MKHWFTHIYNQTTIGISLHIFTIKQLKELVYIKSYKTLLMFFTLTDI